MSSRGREVEHQSASQCEYDTLSTSVTKTADGIWDEHPTLEEAKIGAGDTLPNAAAVPYVSLRDGTTIRVAPMERKCGGWDDEHFHDKLRLPEGVSAGRGVVVTLEAMARECVAVALSPQPYFEMGKTYVVHLGANGNLSTVLRRRLPNETEAVDASFPSRVCTDTRFQPYWVILQNGILSCGVGTVPGRRCIGTLDDSLYNQLRSGVDAVRCVGIGNSALGRNSRDIRVRKVRVMSIPSAFGMEGIPLEEIQQGFINVMEDRGGSGSMASTGASGAGMIGEAELLAEYEKECAKARARAAKFGTEYKQPPPDAFFKWSEARRLRANPERGFVTGFDVMSPDERAKADRRRERFAEEDRKRKMERGEDVEGEEDNDNMEDDNAGGDDEALGASAESKEPLPVEQAWDNEDLVREHRMDPPPKLYAKSEQREDTDEQEKPNDGDDGSDDRKDDIATDEDGEANAFMVPEKIHIFGIDWAAFKQIRSDDIMAYFAAYGPSYVEWLGELSCNILFEDKFSAARALAALSQEVPSPPPESSEAMAAMPTADTTEGSAMDDANGGPDGAASSPMTRSDLGRMGWRFCNLPVRKVANDRFGRRGTRSRILMRVATSLDVLVERPTEWPKPPPGFTTKRVLGPGSDFDTTHRVGRSAKRRKRSSGGRRRSGDRYSDDDYGYDDGGLGGDDGMDGEPSMDQGLKSGRAGFSVEEMEAEREARRKAAEASATDVGVDDEAMQ